MPSTLADRRKPPFPALAGEALCAACSKGGTSCCRTDPDLSYLSFPLSHAEWRRLAPYADLATLPVPGQGELYEQSERLAAQRAAELGPEPAPEAPDGAAIPAEGDALCAVEPNHPDFIASMHALFPGEKERIHELFEPGGRHFSLRIRADGACVFLGEEGCRLPRAVRPWYCRTFPAWIIDGSLTLFLSPECLIAQQAQGPAHGLQLLDRDLGHVRELHKRLRQDWGLSS